ICAHCRGRRGVGRCATLEWSSAHYASPAPTPPASCAATWVVDLQSMPAANWQLRSVGNFRLRRRPAMSDGLLDRLRRGVWRVRLADDWAALAPGDHDTVM